MLLRMRDIQPQLQEKWLQLYWPDDSRWWPAQVTEVSPKRHRAHLLYETGLLLHLDQEQDLSFWPVLSAGEVMLVMLLTAASFTDEAHICRTTCLVHARAGPMICLCLQRLVTKMSVSSKHAVASVGTCVLHHVHRLVPLQCSYVLRCVLTQPEGETKSAGVWAPQQSSHAVCQPQAWSS